MLRVDRVLLAWPQRGFNVLHSEPKANKNTSNKRKNHLITFQISPISVQITEMRVHIGLSQDLEVQQTLVSNMPGNFYLEIADMTDFHGINNTDNLHNYN